ncbi:MAG: hypothetical protein PQJ58_17235 [Spirochaetales bacterium]|nr:hypothetical protein [Spirochaetales bacterium]
MGLKDWFSKNSASGVVSETVKSTISGVGDLVDRFVHTKEEKAELSLALKEFALKEMNQAIEKDSMILADRAGARQMAGIHGKLQSTFALAFLVGFFILLIGEFAFIGFIAKWAISETQPLPPWIQTLIASTLTAVLTYMVSMLKEVVGFLFGGSAGGEQSGAAMVEILNKNNQSMMKEND